MGKIYNKCLNCESEFGYYKGQSSGKYCSNKCQGEHIVKEKLCKGTTMTKAMRKYLNENLGDCCSECGVGREWNGKPLTLQIDHISGDNKDNRIENLRLICPNCHTQTDTWGIGNMSDEGKVRLVDGANKTRKT